MDAGQVYSFLFESFAGVGILVLAVFIIMLLAAVILERRTRKKFRDRGERKGMSLFDDAEDEDDEAETGNGSPADAADGS